MHTTESKCSERLGGGSDLINDACMAPVGDELCDVSSWCVSHEDVMLKLVDWLLESPPLQATDLPQPTRRSEPLGATCSSNNTLAIQSRQRITSLFGQPQDVCQ